MCQRGALRVCDVPEGCVMCQRGALRYQRGALRVCDVPAGSAEGV